MRGRAGRTPSTVQWAPRPERPGPGWTFCKWAGLAVFTAFVVMGVVAPTHAAALFWYALVPALPAVFLVNAEIWRNVCPLATLNMLPTGGRDGLPLDRRSARVATVLGILLLLAAIPARSVVFQGSGPWTATLLAVAGVAAVVSGARYPRKAGFCNAICPLLPVERLYGQSPLAVVRNARCTPCHACTRAACFDLNPGRSALQTIGATGRGRRWVILPFGVFALAFPGVILAFYRLPATSSDPIHAYGAVALGGGLSWVLGAAAASVGRVGPARGLLAAAAVSATMYYWFTPEAAQAAFGLSGPVMWSLRVTGLGLATLWAVHAWRRSRASGGADRGK